jgi:thioredoxin-like negative regulator of GroEL
MDAFGRRCYLLALSAAERGDLSAAARLARLALALDGEQQDKARRLLGICLYELGDTANAADLLAEIPDLADAARETHALTKAGLDAVEQLVRRGKWRAALKAAENIPHQSVRLLNIRGCILAGAKRYARAGRLFASAGEKDRGGRAAPEYLRETAKRAKSFWEFWELWK